MECVAAFFGADVELGRVIVALKLRRVGQSVRVHHNT